MEAPISSTKAFRSRHKWIKHSVDIDELIGDVTTQKGTHFWQQNPLEIRTS